MENEIYHHGTKGMRWGIRRFQRKDGSLTPAGRKRYGQNSTDKTKAKIDSINKKTAEQLKKIKAEGKAASRIAKAEEESAAKIAKAEAKYKPKTKADAPKTKSISEMTDDELRSRINRIQLEKQLASLTPSEVSGGKRFMTSILNDVVAPAAKSAGKKLLTDFLEDRIGTALGLDKKGGDGDDWLKKLAKENERMNTIKKNDELNEYFNKKKNKDSDSDDGGKKTKDKTKPKNGSDDVDDADDSTGKSPKEAKRAAKEAKREAEREVKEELEREREAKESARQSKSEPDVETVTGEIIDVPTGKQTSSSTKKKVDDWIDADWSEVPFGNVLGNKDMSLGRDFVYEIVYAGDDD